MQNSISRCVLLATVGFSLAQVACVTRGQDFSSDISWVQKNKTSQPEVEKYLGAPTAVGNSGGTPTWTYGYYDYRLFGDSKIKELKFYWTADQKVQDYSFNSSFPEDRRRLSLKPAAR